MFPTASSHIYRNEAGEVTGWDNDYGYEPDYDPYDERFFGDDESPYDGDPEGCKAAGQHGVNADEQTDGTWECQSCYDDCTDVINAREREDAEDSPDVIMEACGE